MGRTRTQRVQVPCGGLGKVGHTKLNGRTSWRKLHLSVFRKQERISTWRAGPSEKAYARPESYSPKKSGHSGVTLDLL